MSVVDPPLERPGASSKPKPTYNQQLNAELNLRRRLQWTSKKYSLPGSRKRLLAGVQVVKFPAKATVRALGKHRYRASDGLSAEPTSRRLSAWPDLRAVLEAVLMGAGLALGGAVELEDVGAVWGCSWDQDGDPVMTTG